MFLAHYKPSVFWLVIAVVNITVATVGTVVRFSLPMIDEHQEQPTYVVLARQADRVHERLEQQIVTVSGRVDALQLKVERLEHNEVDVNKGTSK